MTYSPASRALVARGRLIRKQLEPLRSQTEVGALLGLNQQRVDQIEVMALAKLSKKLMALREKL